jgi:hypothetical protein
MPLPPLSYDHLLSLIDDTGIYEHARYGVPRRSHGYTLDDASRALIVLCEEPEDEAVVSAVRVLLAFTLDSLTPEGRFRNRLSFDRQWVDEPETGDTQGRAIWALAVAAVGAPGVELRDAAASALADVPALDSPYLRPLAYAALGGHALWAHDPGHPLASRFAAAAVDRFLMGSSPWPEPRLTYANGRIPAAMLAAGLVGDNEQMIERGLRTLAWLVDVETRGDHFSFTPVGGWQAGEPRPGFDQQPVEAAALSDACARAFQITGEGRWRDAVLRCGEWLLGSNDSGVPLYNPATGSTLDGLMDGAANSNSGAESTIAGLAVLQACRRVEGQTSETRHFRSDADTQT